MTAYDLPNLMPGGSAFGGPAYGQLGLLAPAQQGYNPLTARQPSIVDRVLGRLFPAGQYAGLLDPTAQRGLQRQGLLSLGSSLLQAGGPQAYQGGTLANIGGALQQSQMNFPLMAHQALQIQAYKSQVAEQQAVAQVAAKHPAPPNETPGQRYDRQVAILNDLMTIPGGATIAEKYAPVLAAMKPDKAAAGDWTISPAEGPDGKIHLVRINRSTGETHDTGLFGKQAVKEPTPAERVAASQYQSAHDSIQAMRDIAARNPNAAKQAVAAIKASRYGPLGQLVTEARGTLTDPDAQTFYTHYNNMILAVTPTYGGSRPTQPLMDLEKQSTLPAIGSGDFTTAFGHMDSRLKDLRAKAGKAFQGAGTPAAPTESGGYSADNPFNRP